MSIVILPHGQRVRVADGWDCFVVRSASGCSRVYVRGRFRDEAVLYWDRQKPRPERPARVQSEGQ